MNTTTCTDTAADTGPVASKVTRPSTQPPPSEGSPPDPRATLPIRVRSARWPFVVLAVIAGFFALLSNLVALDAFGLVDALGEDLDVRDLALRDVALWLMFHGLLALGAVEAARERITLIADEDGVRLRTLFGWYDAVRWDEIAEVRSMRTHGIGLVRAIQLVLADPAATLTRLGSLSRFLPRALARGLSGALYFVDDMAPSVIHELNQARRSRASRRS